jgi:GDP-L-fucose synthase
MEEKFFIKMEKDSRITVLGGSGLLGSAIKKVLHQQGFDDVSSPGSSEMNLLDEGGVRKYLKGEQPEHIFMTAGLVGGIGGNSARPADFIDENSMMILNLLRCLKDFSRGTKLLYTGSTCIYPRDSPQPIHENAFMSGPLEETNFGYAVAKIMGIRACQAYREQHGMDTICAMPTNLYGPGDNYDLEDGHMIAALIKKFSDAKKNGGVVEIWGSGKPIREALYSEDCADALVHLMGHHSSGEIVNVGTGTGHSIREFAEIISGVVGGDFDIEWDSSRPDGTLEKRTDIGRLLGVYPEFGPRSLEDGVRDILDNPEEVKRISRS